MCSSIARPKTTSKVAEPKPVSVASTLVFCILCCLPRDTAEQTPDVILFVLAANYDRTGY